MCRSDIIPRYSEATQMPLLPHNLDSEKEAKTDPYKTHLSGHQDIQIYLYH